MTRARALKQVIPARAAKTGELYTTARRHVLNDLHPQTQTVVRFHSMSTPAPVKARTAAPPASSKGGVSYAKSREKTGYGLDHWFEVLDRFGGVEKGHTAAARHLYEAHLVPGWYAQGITVAYERARGVRALNQRCDGEYEVSVSKVMNARTPDVVKALTEPRLRRRWVKDIDVGMVKALSAALDSSASKGAVVRPDGQARFRYKWGDTTVQLYLLPKPGDKVSVVATNSKLSDGAMVEERRGVWRAALQALAQVFSRS
ncbi:MAG: hypothetical protein LC753_16180 [Acidobacteria bacterium]|nr:hypothetical protein [Acidobacteriota bacterium]MCA1651733.1 hypothetical protein [Acidobacteriota bacterium]